MLHIESYDMSQYSMRIPTIPFIYQLFPRVLLAQMLHIESYDMSQYSIRIPTIPFVYQLFPRLLLAQMLHIESYDMSPAELGRGGAQVLLDCVLGLKPGVRNCYIWKKLGVGNRHLWEVFVELLYMGSFATGPETRCG